LKLLLKLEQEAEAELLEERDRIHLGELEPQRVPEPPQELQQEVWVTWTG
jgi:hypothetical protein